MAIKMDAGAKKSLTFAAIAIGSIVVIVGGGIIYTHSVVKKQQNHEINSSIPNFSNSKVQDNVNTGLDGTYNKMAVKKDQLDAAAAEQDGGSFVPSYTPPAQNVNLNQKNKLVNTPVMASQTSYQNQQSTETERMARDEYNKTLDFKRKRVQEMTNEFAQESYSPIMVGSFVPEEKAGGQNLASNQSTVSGGAGISSVFIKAGDKAYISLDTAINTDEPGPVTATILSGPAMGLTLFGKVTQNADDTISVQFTTMSTKSGKSTSVVAYAVDPKTGKTAVEGAVDHKIFERFVLPFVAGGAGAYGQIMQQNGTQMVMSPLAGSTVTTYNLSGQQIAEAAVGQGVGKLADNLNKQAQQAKPSVSTEKNLGLEVVFLKEVEGIK